MNGAKLSYPKPQEVEPVDTGKREQGLRILARMIAHAYARDRKVVRNTAENQIVRIVAETSTVSSSKPTNSKGRIGYA